jgi:glycosyltransferase involved in cell wall biosynthesis
MKVSVLIICYNHEKYIAEAISSVLMQEVDFEYEIVIGEDFSSDQTKRILLEFKEKYPEKIKLYLREKNVGANANLELTLNACNGEYIAGLDGDDYWTSKDKLQKQVNLMESNPELSECFHKVTTIYTDDRKKPHEFPIGLSKNIFNLNDVVSNFFIPSPSTLFRRSAIHRLPAAIHSMVNADWMLHVLCAEKGDIGFIDQVMGVYRVHNGGIWSGITRLKVLENTIKSAHVINNHLNYKFDRLLKRRIARWHLQCAWILLVKEFAIFRGVRHFLQFIYFIV